MNIRYRVELNAAERCYLVVRIDPHKVLPAGYVNK
jgi:hypothetical protein